MKKSTVSLVVAAVFVLLIAINAAAMHHNTYKSEADTESGLEKISQFETRSVESAQKSIKKTQQERRRRELESQMAASSQEGSSQTINYRQVFEDVYIAGDSLMHGLNEYGILNSSHLVTQVSASLYHLSSNFDKIVSMKPPILILHYGLNMCDGRTESFINMYTGLIDRLKTSLPNTRIIISLIFPLKYGRDGNVTQSMIDTYNSALVKMCQKEDIEYLDSTSLVKSHPECYEPDGIHQKRSFYENYWLKFIMAEKGIGQ